MIGRSHGSRRPAARHGLALGLSICLCGVVWVTMRAPLQYRTVLEGQDQRGRYFTTLAVASPNRWQARRLAVQAAEQHGLQIVGIEEVAPMGSASFPGGPRVLRAPWDRTYIPADPDAPAPPG